MEGAESSLLQVGTRPLLVLRLIQRQALWARMLLVPLVDEDQLEVTLEAEMQLEEEGRTMVKLRGDGAKE